METIDAMTGELIEREGPNQVAERKLRELGVITDATFDLFRQQRDLNEQVDTVKYVLKNAMKDNGIKKWDNELFSCSVTPEGTRTVFDSERAKEMTLLEFRTLLNRFLDEDLKDKTVYDFFQKISYVKDKLNIRFKENKNDR